MGVGFPLLAAIFAFDNPFVKNPIMKIFDAFIFEEMEIDPYSLTFFLGGESKIEADDEDVSIFADAEEVEEGAGNAALKELGGGVEVNGEDSVSCGGYGV